MSVHNLTKFVEIDKLLKGVIMKKYTNIPILPVYKNTL